MVTFAVILALIGGINPHFDRLLHDPRKYLKGYAIRICILNVLGFPYAYLALHGFVGPFWGFTWLLLLVWVANFLFSGISRLNQERYYAAADWERSVYFRRAFGFGGAMIGVFVIVLFSRALIGSALFRAPEYRGMAGEVEIRDWQDDLRPINLSHIRMVSQEQAEWVGSQVLGEAGNAIGSRSQIGQYSIQRVKGRLWWVAPLEFRGFRTWFNRRTTDGYVMVSAEEVGRKPELVLDHQFRYMPSAYFGKNLNRYVYQQGYQDVTLHESHFELDEDMHPYWVVTLTRPTIQYWAQEVVGILLVDPETGGITLHDRDHIPDWVDRVIPEKLAARYMDWWGLYVNGWLNSWWGQNDVVETTGEEKSPERMWMVWGDDNQPYWFSGLTSSNSKDKALTGFAMVNSRSGHARSYPLSGANEEAVLQAVNAAVSNFTGYHGTQPVLYCIYGEPAWVVPVASANHIFQRLAIVRATNSRVALGNDRESALREFRTLITTSPNQVVPGEEATVMRQSIIIDRITPDVQNGTTVYYVYCTQFPTKIFTGTSVVSAELPLAREGDQAAISFAEIHEEVVPLITFDLPAITLKKEAVTEK